jgi:putative ABC transport system permease protein
MKAYGNGARIISNLWFLTGERHVYFETIWLDILYALRTLRKNPAFTATALAALAIGIGANSAIFSVVNAVLLRPLSYPGADRIVLFLLTSPTGPSYGGSAAKFNVWRRQTKVFQDVSAYEYSGAQLNLTGGAYPEQIHGIRVSAEYFRLFGAPVVQGRRFTAGEDRPGGGHVVILNYGLWQRRFGGDPRTIGKTISLGGAPYAVVGILGPGFNTELDSPPDIWLPFQIDPNSNDHAQYFNVVARLKPGVSPGMANAQLQLAADEFRGKFPNIMGPRDSFGVQPFQEAIVSDVRPSLLVLAGAVSFVLLIACANVANLLLVRATGRRREMAIRAAIGAARGRIIRQLLIESVVLSTAGGALGLVLGLIGVRALLAVNPGDIPRIGLHGSAIALDWQLLVFTVFVSLLTGILFGLVPALDVSRTDVTAALKEGGGRSGSGRRQNKTRALLVIGEVALAVVLLVGAALLIRTFVALRSVNPGFDAHNVLTLQMSLTGPRFQRTAGVNQLLRDAVQRLEALPGVARAGASYNLPLEGAFGVPYNIVGRPASSGRYDGRGWIGVSSGYFDVFKIPILHGRLFNDRDDTGSGPVAIINQAMARQFWPHGDPLQDRIILGKGYGPEFEEPARQIVGVVGDVHDFGLNRNPTPVVYVPLTQVTDGLTTLAARASALAWIVRTRVEPHSLKIPIENELQQISGGLPVSRTRSMDEVVGQSTARADFNMSLLTIFGCSALLLAAIGIYGLMAYSVRQRSQELGIRMALGAETSDVRNMMVMQGMRLALIGIAIGIGAAFGLTRLIASFLFGVKTWDPLVFTIVPILLSSVALFAVWLPAMRATRIDPVSALRSE